MNDATYTISEFAQRTGLTVRTLRFYEEMELLVPNKYNQAGYRLYGLDELATLQHIQTLKFIGYSLQEIQRLLKEEAPAPHSFESSLSLQHRLLTEKRTELERAIEAIERVQHLLKQGHAPNWAMISSFLYSIKHEEEHKEWMKEYFSEELVAQMYDLTKEEWLHLDHEWMQLLQKIKVLVQRKISPESKEAKAALIGLTELVFKYADEEEFSKQLIEQQERILNDMDHFRFPNVFTQEEEAFLHEAAKALEAEGKNEGSTD
ncbi:MerR family transcriptional regulator [Halalkalibacter oceani]|uniref:MerR family transcriptional regulator n=1 Tax=Halalkalibacter oceani TaxID=1653776 RepID=A0A9X2DTY2_9BACI|nr:MerR family transcriptional regulator [Halalkalibacter oceani]MCM3716372.1 MerR family transcriptional regulator [Halalkalibacter oceani]